MASNFIWYELMTTDVAAAETFYKNVVGWDLAALRQSGMDYIVFNAGERAVAGLMLLPEEAKAMGTPPCWIGYIYRQGRRRCDDERQEGGRRGVPRAVRHSRSRPLLRRRRSAGRCLHADDARTGPDQSRRSPRTTTGHVGWRELYAGDWKSAFDFYSSQFGWTKDEAMDMGEMGTYQVFAIDGEQAGGMMNKPPQMPVPAWIFYFNVD